ncbi:Tfp pilus assembly protein PilF [Lysobacter niastensis]|uniref:Tfp pilus assembly protein PilF n=1 Tax=Lysobacter niastensis TaxID=380629 RepID=A0ABU1WA29_9GAMM|nr:hypothetical protein [Lysobacter niastensis]MDR7134487.1 Tfp pilus assembly protein PilF [Lysobacter niastensis]
MFRAWLLIAGLMMTSAAWAQRPPAVVPDDPDSVIARLPRGYAQLMPAALSAVPVKTPVASTAQARVFLTTAARTGDARLATRADALLARMPERVDGVLLMRAFSAQHRHDFEGAVAWLDRLIARSPRNATARLSRAQIQVVLGRLELARGDCAALVLGIDAGDGLLCVGLLSLRNGQYPAAAAALDHWLQGDSGVDERRYALVMRAEVAARAGDGDADLWFQRALALVPDDVRTLASYARYLRSVGRDRDVLRLLAVQTEHDGLRLQRTLAAYRLDPQTAAPLVQAQARRFAAARTAGSPLELRDEAEFMLSTRTDPDAALILAQRNFLGQRDFEDVELLRRAAIAAKRSDVLRELQRWTTSRHLPWPPTPEVAR